MRQPRARFVAASVLTSFLALAACSGDDNTSVSPLDAGPRDGTSGVRDSSLPSTDSSVSTDASTGEDTSSPGDDSSTATDSADDTNTTSSDGGDSAVSDATTSDSADAPSLDSADAAVTDANVDQQADDASGDADAGSADASDGACAPLVNAAPSVPIVSVAQDPPAQTGGSIVAGTYYLTQFRHYSGVDGGSGSNGSTVQTTIVFTASMIDAVMLAQFDGGGGMSGRATGTYVASSNTLTVTPTCGQLNPTTYTVPSADGGTITLQLLDDQNNLQTYAKQ
jgi:hypothetical protein